ncbi:VOC family protein [Streptomyces sp. NPDC001604]|uniref:VOC family protein n=1 Tax=Streptomyces sp. NPDC001604 TaxID=3364593 RepID=UPI0036C05345
MDGRPSHQPGTPRMSRNDWWGVVLEAPDPQALARFYAELLGWEIAKEDDDGAAIAPSEGVAYIAFQRGHGYVPPVWPARDGAQRITMHLDFEVVDLQEAVAHALVLGARESGHQPQDDVRVLLDPAGHPFCLYRDGSSAQRGNAGERE